MNDNVGYLYLFGSWEKMQQISAILSERHAKRRKPRVVAVIYGKPCGNIPGVDRWFCLSREVMPPERIQSFIQTLQQRLGRFWKQKMHGFWKKQVENSVVRKVAKQSRVQKKTRTGLLSEKCCAGFKIYSSNFRTAVNASLGTLTVPSWRILRLPSFCFSSSFFFRVISPP